MLGHLLGRNPLQELFDERAIILQGYLVKTPTNIHLPRPNEHRSKDRSRSRRASRNSISMASSTRLSAFRALFASTSLPSLLPLALLLMLLQQDTLAFLHPKAFAFSSTAAAGPTQRVRQPIVEMMAGDGASSTLSAGTVAVVVGYQSGAAQLLAAKMATMHKDAIVRAIFDKGDDSDSEAASFPVNVQVTYKNLESVMAEDLAGASVALISLDKGPGAEVGADPGNYLSLPTLLAAIPESAKVLVAAYANDTSGTGQGGGGGLQLNIFAKGVNPKEAVEAIRRESGGSRIVLVQHARLFGAANPFTVGGKATQPLPFVSGPLQRPVVEESYAKQNILLALGSSLSRNANAATLRSTLAEAMVRAVEVVGSIADFSVVSLEGQAPCVGDWEQQLAGLDTRGGVTVFEKVLAANERVDLPVLQDWLKDDFGAGLSTLAISRVLNSPKPAIVAMTDSGADIIWQFVQKDLKIRGSGRWCIQLDNVSKSIKILREDATGGMLTEALPGEEELLQRFSAAINRLVYSRKLSKRR